MKKKYQNGFFAFGLLVLIVMVTQLDFGQVWGGLKHAGYWFFAVVALWAILYVFNAAAWYTIIKAQVSKEELERQEKETGKPVSATPFSFWWLYTFILSPNILRCIILVQADFGTAFLHLESIRLSAESLLLVLLLCASCDSRRRDAVGIFNLVFQFVHRHIALDFAVFDD